jgi:hypothetical protein
MKALTLTTPSFTPHARRLPGILLALALMFVVLPALGQAPEPESAQAVAQSTPDVDAFIPDFVNDSMGDTFIPALAIIMVFGAPPLLILLLALLVFRHREKQQQLMNERLQRFLEAGQPIPEELLKSGVVEASPAQLLNRGLTLLGLGIGLGIFLGLMMSWKAASLALIPIGMGIAKLISWKLSAPKQD